MNRPRKSIAELLAERQAAASEAKPVDPIPSNDVCGARTKRGTLCQSRDLYRSGRCKHHGGMSTGPKSAAGKARVAMNGLAPKKAKPMGTCQNLTSAPEKT